jgi:Flp pilus assembly protein TadG
VNVSIRFRFRRTRRRSRGQSIVELALIMPIMLLLLATASDLGRLFHSKIVVANAARAGALEAARHPTSFVPSAACDALTNRIMCAVAAEATGSLVTITPSDVNVACTPSPCAEALGNVIVVSVENEFTLVTPFLGAIFGGQTIPIATSATAQIAVQPNTTPAGPTASPSATPSPSPSPSPTPTLDPSATPGPSPTPTPTPSPTPICFAPVADFTFTPFTGKKKKTDFVFTDLSTTTPECPLTWSWNFGDGAGASSTSSLQNPVHQYQAQGGFTITLVVSNAGGTDSDSHSITVTP